MQLDDMTQYDYTILNEEDGLLHLPYSYVHSYICTLYTVRSTIYIHFRTLLYRPVVVQSFRTLLDCVCVCVVFVVFFLRITLLSLDLCRADDSQMVAFLSLCLAYTLSKANSSLDEDLEHYQLVSPFNCLV